MVAPVYIECYVITCLAVHCVGMGFVLAFPTSLVRGLTQTSSDLRTTKDTASWIIASYTITSALSYFILPQFMQAFGRKLSNSLHNLLLLVGAGFIALAPNVGCLITGQCIQGFGFCGLALNHMIVAEYSHPKRRGYILALTNGATNMGILLSHTQSFFLHWRQMAWLGAVFPTIGLISTFLWPESPSWLAYKERYDECAKAFEILRGRDVESRKELRHLISAQREIRKSRKLDGKFAEIIKTFTSKEFLKPLLILSVVEMMVQVSGIYYVLAYVIQIMERLSGDKTKTFYYIIGLDVLQIIACLLSSVIVKLTKMRTLLFYAGSVACFLLGMVCIFDYLETIEVLSLRWLTPAVLILFRCVCNIGITPTFILVTSEILPLQYKSTGACVTGVIFCIMSFLILKYTTVMLDLIKVCGTFAVYLSLLIVCLIFLFFFLPETKNRTLQDIETEFINLELDDFEDTIAKLNN